MKKKKNNKEIETIILWLTLVNLLFAIVLKVCESF